MDWIVTYKASGAQYIANVLLLQGTSQHSSTISGNPNCLRIWIGNCSWSTVNNKCSFQYSCLRCQMLKHMYTVLWYWSNINYPRKYCPECNYNNFITYYTDDSSVLGSHSREKRKRFVRGQWILINLSRYLKMNS